MQAKLYRKFANQALEQLAHEHNIPLDAMSLITSRADKAATPTHTPNAS